MKNIEKKNSSSFFKYIIYVFFVSATFFSACNQSVHTDYRTPQGGSATPLSPSWIPGPNGVLIPAPASSIIPIPTTINNTANPGVSPVVTPSTTTAPTYAIDVKPILDAQCAGCHSGSRAPNLSIYPTSATDVNSAISAMESGAMPKNKAAVPADQIAKIKAWRDGGMKP